MEKRKLNRLEKYANWLAYDRNYDPAAYNLVNQIILMKSIPDYTKKVLNQIETEYQKYLQTIKK